MEAVKKYWLEGNISETLSEIGRFLHANDGSTPDPEALLWFAYIFYQLGSMKRAAELLNKFKDDVFNMKQLVVENNILVLKQFGSNSYENQKAVALAFGLLHEKTAGLPFADVRLLEVKVCLNYALVIFCSTHQRVLVPGGYNVSQAVLLKTLHRVLCGRPQNDPLHGTNHFTEENLQFYFKNSAKHKQEVNLVALLVWCLASNFFINGQVSEAQRIMKIVVDFYKPNAATAENVDLTFTLMADTSNLQDYLIAACHLLYSYLWFMLKEKSLSMKHCDNCLSLQSEFIGGLFMKGFLLYQSKKHEDAVQYFQQIIAQSTDSGYKATAFNFLGCISVKMGKPHVGLLKFRESFSCHSGHLEALYNVALVYHDAGEFDLEVAAWKYVLKILSFRDWHVSKATMRINMDYICGVTTQALDDPSLEDRLLISTDVHCLQRFDIRNQKLSLPSVLIKVARSCLMMKRFSEASEFYGQLLAHLNDRPVDLHECGVSSLVTVYKEYSDVLFKCGRYGDCLVVCEKTLSLDTTLETIDSQVDGETFAIHKTLIELMLCKASALKELERPIEANECYDSILDIISKRCNSSCNVESTLEEPKLKRQKKELDPPKDDQSILVENYTKLKALTLYNQSLLLMSLGKKKEAKLLLAQSISYQPVCLKYRYIFTKLLIDMGMEDEASKEWLKFRRDEQSMESSNDNFKLKDLPEDEEDRDLYEEMDSRTISKLRKNF